MCPVQEHEDVGNDTASVSHNHDEPPTKRKAVQLKAWQRKRKVWNLLCMGYEQHEIAHELGVSYSTIERDIKDILAPIDLEKEKAKLNQDIKWDLRQATLHYAKEPNAREKREWLGLRTRVNQVRSNVLRSVAVTVNNINTQNNLTQNKVDIHVLLAGIKQDREKAREEEKKKKGEVIQATNTP